MSWKRDFRALAATRTSSLDWIKDVLLVTAAAVIDALVWLTRPSLRKTMQAPDHWPTTDHQVVNTSGCRVIQFPNRRSGSQLER
jgi:hypothetical protein